MASGEASWSAGAASSVGARRSDGALRGVGGLRQVERLGEVIERAAFHGLDGRVQVPMRGNDEDRGCRRRSFQFGECGQAVHAGKAHVEENDIRRAGRGLLKSGLGGRRHGHAKPLALEGALQRPRNRLLIVDNQDGGHAGIVAVRQRSGLRSVKLPARQLIFPQSRNIRISRYFRIHRTRGQGRIRSARTPAAGTRAMFVCPGLLTPRQDATPRPQAPGRPYLLSRGGPVNSERLSAHLDIDRYGSYRLTDAVRPGPGLAIPPRKATASRRTATAKRNSVCPCFPPPSPPNASSTPSWP